MIKRRLMEDMGKLCIMFPWQEGFTTSGYIECPLFRDYCRENCACFGQDDENYYCSAVGVQPDNFIGRKYKKNE